MMSLESRDKKHDKQNIPSKFIPQMVLLLLPSKRPTSFVPISDSSNSFPVDH
jgi:hypothetical protein